MLFLLGLMIVASIASIMLPAYYIKNYNVAIFTSFALVFIYGGVFVFLIWYLKNSFYLKLKGLYRE